MNQMEIFKNPEFGSIRTFEQDGKVLFCGLDIAVALGYSNPRDGVNPGLTDLFIRQARKTMQEQQKSSVLQKLRQEPPVRKPAAPKKREPER